MSVIYNDHVLVGGRQILYSYRANANVSDRCSLCPFLSIIASVISKVLARTHVPSTALKILQYE